MLVLHAFNIKKFYGERLILRFDDLKIYHGERIGIVGANGSGKTTLLDLLAGCRYPDEGSLELHTRFSYIRQEDSSAAAPDRKLSREFMVSGLDKTCASGGEKTRLQIASSFIESAGLLFADEPTTNLDLAGIKLLEEKLAAFRGAMLLVSHDRSLLERLCRKIIEIRDARLLVYQGNYSDYLRQREAAFERQLFDYQQYIREKNRLEETLGERRGNVNKIRKTPKRMGNSEARLHKRESTEIQGKLNQTIKAVETRLEKLAIKEKPQELPKIKININLAADTVSKTVASGREINLYFGSRCIFHNACFEIPRGKKTALMGANGCGKTTLANLIASGGPGVRLAPGTKTGYFNQELMSNLDFRDTVLDNIMKESSQPESTVRTILARFLFRGNDVFKKAAVLSGGEKVKLSLVKILTGGANFIILDEPTNYLDIVSMEALEDVLQDYAGTLLIISHDRRLVGKVSDRLLVIEDCTIKTFEGHIEEYNYDCQGEPAEREKGLEDMLLKLKLCELAGKIAECGDEQERSRLDEEYKKLIKK